MAAVAATVVATTGGLARPHVVSAHPHSSLSSTPVQVWLSDPGAGVHLTQQPSLSTMVGTSTEAVTVNVDTTQTYQSMVGFGASFTDSSAWLVHEHLSAADKDALMTALFSPTNGIGLTMLRQPMGASDFAVAGPYSYDDVTVGQTDHGLAQFSIAHDQPYILPLLQQARALAPNLSIISEPWSPPGWMKSGQSMIGSVGGSLNADSYGDWAQYFVKFLQAYAAAGVPVQYITPQNEPLNTADTYPGMLISAQDEAMLIKTYLGPALANAGSSTKILDYDFTWDNAYYPETVLSDPAAAAYVSGTSWHCYGGNPEEQTPVHDQFPTKDAFMTECTGVFANLNEPSALQGDMKLMIGSTRNWARGVTLWNMALDQAGGPSNGCADCQGVVTITLGTDGAFHWTPTIDYYALGHFAKFVRPGAVRVGSTNLPMGITDTAFVNPDGSKVVVAFNNGPATQEFGVQVGGSWVKYTLNSNAAATFILP